jgi:uncharacterized protein
MKKHFWKKLLIWTGFAALLIMLLLIGLQVIAYWPPHFKRSEMTIHTAAGHDIPYKIEIATTPHEQEYGLMFRRSMPKQAGMLFLFNPDFDPEKGVAFWMKNTKIPLDMIFVSDNGTINEVHANAQPDDLTPIAPAEPARAVVEINGGEAKSLGIKAGDKVVYPGFRAQ